MCFNCRLFRFLLVHRYEPVTNIIYPSYLIIPIWNIDVSRWLSLQWAGRLPSIAYLLQCVFVWMLCSFRMHPVACFARTNHCIQGDPRVVRCPTELGTQLRIHFQRIRRSIYLFIETLNITKLLKIFWQVSIYMNYTFVTLKLNWDPCWRYIMKTICATILAIEESTELKVGEALSPNGDLLKISVKVQLFCRSLFCTVRNLIFLKFDFWILKHSTTLFQNVVYYTSVKACIALTEEVRNLQELIHFNVH